MGNIDLCMTNLKLVSDRQRLSLAGSHPCGGPAEDPLPPQAFLIPPYPLSICTPCPVTTRTLVLKNIGFFFTEIIAELSALDFHFW